MLKCETEFQGAVFTLRLSGTLDESATLPQPPLEGVRTVRVVTRGLTRINSGGIKIWTRYFQGIVARKLPLVLQECSPVVMEQLNAHGRFTDRARIESVLVPFLCRACCTDLVALMATDRILAISGRIAPMKCPKCAGRAEFDDYPEEYFACLFRPGEPAVPEVSAARSHPETGSVAPRRPGGGGST